MCRNIKKLRRPEGIPADHELQDAALQFIRKISGYHTPSVANRDPFEAAVRDVASVARSLFRSLKVRPSNGRARPVSHHSHSLR